MATRRPASRSPSPPARRRVLPPPELVVLMAPEVDLRASAGRFEASRGFSVRGLGNVLARHGARLVPAFGPTEERVMARAAPRTDATRAAAPDLSRFYRVEVPRVRLADARHDLARNRLVSAAYIKPPVELPVVNAMLPSSTEPPAATPPFDVRQLYLDPPPGGIDARWAWQQNGGRGRDIRIIDVEGDWRFTHEDLLTNQGGVLGGDTNGFTPDVSWRNHGTAVLGEMVSLPNSRGCVGIAHDASAVVQSAVIGGVFNLAQALTNATAHLRAGDAILIELQATGPNGKYVAMQYWPDIFSAIVAATAKGITVVEAAGNGNENFDLPIFNNTGLQKDSGAIVVGAGVPPANAFDFDGSGGFGASYQSIGVPRSRIWFSNYGKIVNVQGWGFHVTTLAYGDLQGHSSENRWYTARFSGTSSASPIVTGAVACIQGRARAKLGAPLTPARVRKILMATGTRQLPGPGVPLSQRIGPQPNLVKAMTKV